MPDKVKVKADLDNGFKKVKIDYSGLHEAAKSSPKKQIKEVHMPNFEEQFATNAKSMAASFKNIDKMSSEELTKLVVDKFDAVISFCNSKKYDDIQFIWGLFNNIRYVLALANVLNSTVVNYHYVSALNYVLYNMYTSSNSISKEVAAAHAELSKVVNKSTIADLSGINLPEGSKTAADIGMCIYSTSDSHVSIQRLNLYMINCCEQKQLYSEEMIVRIYESLYAKTFSTLFEGVMFDVYSKQDMFNLTPSQQDTYYTINTAILDMLVQAPEQVIYTVLKNYTIDYSYLNGPAVRFRMILSADYSRINRVIAMLQDEDIFVP